MAKAKLTVLYKRSKPGEHSAYDPGVEKGMTKLTGPDAKYRPSPIFPRCRLENGGGFLERHEDGPALVATTLTLLPAYISAAAALVALWMNRKKKRGEKTTIEISGDGFSHSIEIKSEDDAKLAQKLIRHYGR